MRIEDISIEMTVGKTEIRKAVRLYFKMFHAMLPNDYLITDTNDEVVQAVINSVKHAASNSESKDGTAVIKIKTEISGPNTPVKFGLPARRAEHIVFDVYKSSIMKFVEVF